MDIFPLLFLQKFSKIFPKTHQIAPFKKKIIWGTCPNPPPPPPIQRVALIATRKYPHFSKVFSTTPPPPA